MPLYHRVHWRYCHKQATLKMSIQGTARSSQRLHELPNSQASRLLSLARCGRSLALESVLHTEAYEWETCSECSDGISGVKCPAAACQSLQA